MKKYHTTEKGRVVVVSKNSDTNGYIMTFPNDQEMHVQFWWNSSVRSWYAAAHDDNGHQVGESEFCYLKEDAIDNALRIVDAIVDNTFEPNCY